MRKRFKILTLTLMSLSILFAAFWLSGCTKEPEAQSIKIEFEGNTQYFSGSVKMLPIKGEMPTENETGITEKAVIKVKCSAGTKLKLILRYAAGTQGIAGLTALTAFGATAVTDGMTLYESKNTETSADIAVVFFLRKETPISEAGKTVRFTFVAEAEEVTNEG